MPLTPPASRGATPHLTFSDFENFSSTNLRQGLDKYNVGYKSKDEKFGLISKIISSPSADNIKKYILELEDESEPGTKGSKKTNKPSSAKNHSSSRRNQHSRHSGDESVSDSTVPHKPKNGETRSRTGKDRGRSSDRQNSKLSRNGDSEDSRSGDSDDSKDKREKNWNKSNTTSQPNNPKHGTSSHNDVLARRFQKLQNKSETLSSRKIDKKGKRDAVKPLERLDNKPEFDDAEKELLQDKEIAKLLPNLDAATQDILYEVMRMSLLYKTHVPRGVEHFWFIADQALAQNDLAMAQRIITGAAEMDIWDSWWNGSQSEAQIQQWQGLQDFVRFVRNKHRDISMNTTPVPSHTSSPLSSPALTNDENDPYDCKEARRVRKKFHGNGDPKADEMEFEDPETGEIVTADIIGRHPTRRNWLALALPSNNSNHMFMSRGYYVDGTKEKYKEQLDRYVNEGSNVTLNAATKTAHLREAEVEDFELNLVLFMPWGKYWHTHAYGIPHYDKDRDFMLYSKSLLGQAWGTSTADDVIRDHCDQAGQPIPRTAQAARKIQRRAWKH
ncbi:hypothetical protein QQS21_002085 [Conoideocrella luteorostrata]|uniref:Uncharacterized protein n=1 Tax=Conoideocrella luteorostrata TaxID=1105319 RepID=A0AAJ0G1J1_9HYPO|nr:hypothetical protein QQS21_002085 [Conoideocrella luteorostrata]